jgi:hypothetical protein
VPATPLGLCALRKARLYLGTKEQPPDSNRGPLIDSWNRAAGVPVGSRWCMSFVHSMFLACGRALGGGASVGNFEAWVRHGGGQLVARPFAGDVVCYRFDADDWPDHTGIVERVLALRWSGRTFVGWVRIVEGNTSLGNDANGGAVMRRTRWIKRARFARIT